MKIKKSYLTIGIIFLLLIVGWLFVRFVIGGDEDSWIKDEKGIWIKHGNPAEISNYVLKQQNVINCAIRKFNEVTKEVNSQCLGTCEDYAVDIVHVPRTSEDDLIENQCDAYRNEQVNHFIELDKNGEIVRIL